MRVDLLDYELPPDLIAQTPPEARDGGRMLVIDPLSEDEAILADRQVRDLASELPERALLVVNDTRVLSARLFAKKPETGGKVEIFLVRPEGPGQYERPVEGGPPVVVEGEVWRALGKASKPLRFDQNLEVGDDLMVRILGRAPDDGLLRVLLVSTMETSAAIAAYGHVPLPPYIKRSDDDTDVERYQTVFARKTGAIAAPTAGLHLSNALLGRLSIAGVEVATITLHVGLGTFQPVQVDDLDAHPMHEEPFEIGRAAAETIVRARREGRAVIAVGTTVVRALEAGARLAHERGAKDPIEACAASTKLLLQPGERLRIVDGVLTNFHLPRSTLLALVATFVGVQNLKRAYAHAIAERYRFYSYGDAMLVRRALESARVAKS